MVELVTQLMPSLKSVELDLRRDDKVHLLPLTTLKQLKSLSFRTRFLLPPALTREVGSNHHGMAGGWRLAAHRR